MLHLQLRSTIRAREQMVKTSRAPHVTAPDANAFDCERNPRAPPNPQRPRYGVQTRLSHAFAPRVRTRATRAPTAPQNVIQRTERGAQPRHARQGTRRETKHTARDEAHGARRSTRRYTRARRATHIRAGHQTRRRSTAHSQPSAAPPSQRRH